MKYDFIDLGELDLCTDIDSQGKCKKKKIHIQMHTCIVFKAGF